MKLISILSGCYVANQELTWLPMDFLCSTQKIGSSFLFFASFCEKSTTLPLVSDLELWERRFLSLLEAFLYSWMLVIICFPPKYPFTKVWFANSKVRTFYSYSLSLQVQGISKNAFLRLNPTDFIICIKKNNTNKIRCLYVWGGMKDEWNTICWCFL